MAIASRLWLSELDLDLCVLNAVYIVAACSERAGVLPCPDHFGGLGPLSLGCNVERSRRWRYRWMVERK